MSEELKPCPFCGSKALLHTEGNDYTKKRRSIAECSKCHVKMTVGAIRFPLSWTIEIVTEKWNTRKGDNNGTEF